MERDLYALPEWLHVGAQVDLTIGQSPSRITYCSVRVEALSDLGIGTADGRFTPWPVVTLIERCR